MYHKVVVCLLLRNAHKMTRQAALNGCTELETVLCAFLKSKQTTYLYFCNIVDDKFASLINVFEFKKKIKLV